MKGFRVQRKDIKDIKDTRDIRTLLSFQSFMSLPETLNRTHHFFSASVFFSAIAKS